MLDWPRASALPWKARRAAVEVAAREYLAALAGVVPGGTRGLSVALYPRGSDQEHKAIGAELLKLAPLMGAPWATHDGEKFISYGRVNHRWRWHGQAGATSTAPEASGIAENSRVEGGAQCISCGQRTVHVGRCTACGKR